MSTILSKNLPYYNQLASHLDFNWNPREYLTIKNIASALSISVAGLSLAYIAKIYYSYRFFKKRGIKTPKYSFFFGNFPELKEKNYSDIIRSWTQELGKTYGYYEGHMPILVTSDLDIIQEVFIKQYSNFSARKPGAVSENDDGPKTNLFSSTKSRWKRMRTIMNPTFSSSKLKELSPLMIICIDRLIQVLSNHQNKEINVTDFFKRFTMDTIWNCAFGMDINFQVEKTADSEVYYQKCEQVIQMTNNFNFLIYFGTYFHEFKSQVVSSLLLMTKIMKYLGVDVSVNPFYWLSDKVLEIIENRMSQHSSRNDYLKLLLNARTIGDDLDLSKNELTFKDKYVEKKLTMSEIQMNLVLFMLAGYETSSTTLTYGCFVMARQPEIQEELYEEIMSFYPDDLEPQLDTLSKLTYLDMFIKETLRMYPIANSVVLRRCTNATRIKDIDIPVDLSIAIDVMSVHYDEELWGPVDPNTFYPRRFAPDQKRNPLAFLGFGIGPRNCIGMKFALQELKFAIVKLLKRYEILAGPHTPDKLEILEGAVRTPKGGLNVIFRERNAKI